jgi:hypothetical protein
MFIMASEEVTKKRKKSLKDATDHTVPFSKRRVVASDKTQDEQAKIEELEGQIAESRKYYNNIATLLSMLNADNLAEQPNLAVAVSLCRVFCRLMAGGNLQEPPKATEQEKILIAWLKERLQEYQRGLLTIVRHADSSSRVCTSQDFSRASFLMVLSSRSHASHWPCGSPTHDLRTFPGQSLKLGHPVSFKVFLKPWLRLKMVIFSGHTFWRNL